jgi:hypothetical protein
MTPMRNLTLPILLAGVVTLFATDASAVDGSKSASRSMQFGSWQVIEFAGREQLIYRFVSDSTSRAETHLAFDVAPSDHCAPHAAVLISNMGRFNPTYADGLMPLSFKIPGQAEVQEITKSAMERGSPLAFFQFTKLSAAGLMSANDRGSLAVWIPGRGDGHVKRSSNIYFALDGYGAAYASARQQCLDNSR